MDRKNPFEGMRRRRLPGMHMMTAVHGGMPLCQALAAFFFLQQHNCFPHDCLVKEANDDIMGGIQLATGETTSPDGAGLAFAFGAMASADLILEEWSYLPDEVASIFLGMADAATQEVQRWICDGVELPMRIPLGPLVQRPSWAVSRYADRDGEDPPEYIRNARAHVAKLQAEVARDRE